MPDIVSRKINGLVGELLRIPWAFNTPLLVTQYSHSAVHIFQRSRSFLFESIIRQQRHREMLVYKRERGSNRQRCGWKADRSKGSFATATLSRYHLPSTKQLQFHTWKEYEVEHEDVYCWCVEEDANQRKGILKYTDRRQKRTCLASSQVREHYQTRSIPVIPSKWVISESILEPFAHSVRPK
jgi:hypothetical protein